MSTTYRVQVGRRGVVTLPKKLRDELKIADGESLTLIQLTENSFVLSRGRSRVDEAADRLAEDWQESGATLDSMLTTLRQVRAEYNAEKP